MDDDKNKDQIGEGITIVLGWLMLVAVALCLLWLNLTVLRGCVELISGR